MAEKRLQILIPCHNEEENIDQIVIEIERFLAPLPYHYEFLFIDDGSTDNTFEKIRLLTDKRSDVKVIKFSRNFGKEAAIAAGLKESNADAVILIDSDLQHPPSLIPAMITEWEQGYNIVDAVKTVRQKENLLTRSMSLIFNRLMGSITGIDFKGASDYKLLDRHAIEVLNRIQEKSRFFRGLTNWIGFRHIKIQYQVQDRNSGISKWNLFKLFQLSIDAITSFSSKPLQIVTVLGFLTFCFSVLLGAQTLYNKIFGTAVDGFTTVILVTLMLSSIIMLSIGIVGTYIAKLFDEVKNRPMYVVEDHNTAQILFMNNRCTENSTVVLKENHIKG